jgi:hypothetical protein
LRLLGQETLTKTLLQPKQPRLKQGIPVKRKALALIIVLLSSMLVGMQFIDKARAETLGPIYIPIREYPSSTKVRISSPQQNHKYNASSILLNFTVEAYESIYDVGYSLDGRTVERVNNFTKISEVLAPEIRNLTPNWVRVTFMGSLFLSYLSEGKHSVTVYQGYQYQNRYEVSAYAYVNFTIGDIPPNIQILSPETKVYNTSDVQLNFTVDEPVSQISYSLDGRDNVTVVGNRTLPDLSEGEHNVTVYAIDSGGKVGTSETVAFTIVKEPELPEPFPTALVTTTSIITIVVVSVGLLVYFKKHKKVGDKK